MSKSLDVNELLSWPVYGLSNDDKEFKLFDVIRDLTEFHTHACADYSTIINKLGLSLNYCRLEDVPFIPVRLFKLQELISVPPADIVKTMTSSGTSGQAVSKIFLDKITSALQVKILSRIVSNYIGPARLPMLVIDCRATVSDRFKFSARTAGVLGFSIFGRDIEYALDDDMSLNIDRVKDFINKYPNQPILFFGFTYIVWLHFIKVLEERSIKLNISAGILIHGGGWKKLESQSVNSKEFSLRLQTVTGIKKVHNYYGMIEQTGSIFMECENGYLHTSSWSEIIIRNPLDFSVQSPGEPGLIQLISVIPRSYPGHSLLSEDVGYVVGKEDCPCGRSGTYFHVTGRLQNAEIRGCSDTYTN